MRIYHAVEEVQREVTFRKLLVHTSKGRSSIVILLFLRIKALEKCFLKNLVSTLLCRNMYAIQYGIQKIFAYQ